MIAWTKRFRASIAELPAEQVALLLIVGLVVGVFPIMGCPTILCLLAALGFRINAAALQLLNQVTSPLQLALLVPLARAGAWLCRAESGTFAVRNLGLGAVHAVVGWTCICLPLGLLTYGFLILIMRKRRQSWCNSIESPA